METNDLGRGSSLIMDSFSARVSELEVKLQAAVRAVEEKARSQIEEVVRKTDAEIRRLSVISCAHCNFRGKVKGEKHVLWHRGKERSKFCKATSEKRKFQWVALMTAPRWKHY